MDKGKFAFLALASILILFGTTLAPSFSDETNDSAPRIGADHPFYFLKRWGEGVKIAFARSEARAEIRQEFAKERLLEARALFAKNKTESAEKILSDAEREIGESAKEAEKLERENKTRGLENALLRHQENLERFSQLVISLCSEESNSSSRSGGNLSNDRRCIALENAEKRMEARNDAFSALVNRSIALRNSLVARIGELNLTSEQRERIRIRIEERLGEIRGEISERRESIRERIGNFTGKNGTFGGACIQVVTFALDPKTGECKDYPTPCDVPAGFRKFMTRSACESAPALPGTVPPLNGTRPGPNFRDEISNSGGISESDLGSLESEISGLSGSGEEVLFGGDETFEENLLG